MSHVAVDEEGQFRQQGYSIPHKLPEGVPDIFKQWVEEDAQLPPASVLFGSRFILIDAVKASPRGSVYLALDLGPAGPRQVALKEGRRHCNSDALGRDIRFRLRRQLDLHERLDGRVNVPPAYDYVEINENGYLVLEWIEGVDFERFVRAPLGALPIPEQDQMLDTISIILDQIERLHASGYVHRDLTPANIMIADDGTPWLIDLELAHQLGSNETPFTQGTAGFVSPQQVAGDIPAIADDVYGAGALVAFALTGIDPRRFVDSSTDPRAEDIRHLALCPPMAAQGIARALRVEPSRRGVIADLRHSISQARETRPAILLSKVSGDERCERVRLALLGLRDYATDPATGLWLSAASAPAKGIISDYSLHRSANRGVAGVLYAIAKASNVVTVPDELRLLVDRAADWLLVHAPTADDQLPGLHFGESGVAVALAECVRGGLLETGTWVEGYFSEALNGPLDWPDLTHGAAGQGLAAYICADSLRRSNLASNAVRCAEYLLSTQRSDGAWELPEGVENMSGDCLTGFAHGAAGCIYFLAEHAIRTADQRSRAAAEFGAEWLKSQAIAVGGALTWPTRAGGNDYWRWWCHGAPGIALAYLKLHQLSGHAEYALLARSALGGVPVHIRYSNLTQCHGLAGIADIYFTAARCLSDDEYLVRGLEITDTLWAMRRQSAHGVTWLAEDPIAPTADLMVGGSGCLHSLVNALSPLSGAPPLVAEGACAASTSRRKPRQGAACETRAPAGEMA
jgi:hypothetical protein